MRSTTKTLLFSFALFAFLNAAAQECNYYHRKNCNNDSEYEMSYDGQSRSAILGKGQTSEFHMVAYDGMDYRITVCAESNLGDQVNLKIYEKRRVLIKPEEVEIEQDYQEEQIKLEAEDAYADETYDVYTDDSYSDDSYNDPYSDYSDSYSEEPVAQESKQPKFKLVKELLFDNTKDSLTNTIEFSAEGSMSLVIEVGISGEKQKSKLALRNMGCVGVLIEHSRTRRLGF